MDVSENSGTPKSFILRRCSIINHPFRGTPIFGNTHNKRPRNQQQLPCSSAAVTAESAVVELEHFIGYGGKQLGTIRYHPLEVWETLLTQSHGGGMGLMMVETKWGKKSELWKKTLEMFVFFVFFLVGLLIVILIWDTCFNE